MSQSAIWDALLIVGDALQDGRLDDAERVLVEIDAMDAWAFRHRRVVKVHYAPGPLEASTIGSLTAMYKKLYTPNEVTKAVMRKHPLRDITMMPTRFK